MSKIKILLLPGDGIGPEIASGLKTLMNWYDKNNIVNFEIEEELVGGACYDKHQVCILDSTVEKAKKADAVLFGAVGGEKWANVPYEQRPEAGILRLRKDLVLFANVRPAYCYPALVHASSLKPEVVNGLDLVIVREATAGVYFGEPKEIRTLPNGQEVACDNQIYHTFEIERAARFAFELARKRKNKVSSVEKHNVMKTGILWKKTVTRIHNEEYPDVTLEHVLADNCAMQLVRNPKQFDVIVTDNLFGDILSDAAAMLTGSLGMLPSASLGLPDPKTGKVNALYEPVHGSAPDIAGRNLANPLAMVGSLSLAFKNSLNLPIVAEVLDQAVATVLQKNIRTKDIAELNSNVVGTTGMIDAIIHELEVYYG